MESSSWPRRGGDTVGRSTAPRCGRAGWVLAVVGRLVLVLVNGVSDDRRGKRVEVAGRRLRERSGIKPIVPRGPAASRVVRFKLTHYRTDCSVGGP